MKWRGAMMAQVVPARGCWKKKASRFGQTVANFGRDWKKKKMAEEGVAAGLERRARLGMQELAW
jgi:hypothetical protein